MKRFKIIGTSRYYPAREILKKDLTVGGREIYKNTTKMKYQLKGVMASTENDSVNLGYPTLGGQEVRKSCYVLKARLNNPFIKGVEQYKRIVICQK